MLQICSSSYSLGTQKIDIKNYLEEKFSEEIRKKLKIESKLSKRADLK
jgi:hypothetical protein